MAHWLLEVEIDGVPYRWTSAPDGAEVTTDAGVVLLYHSGLEDLSLAQGDEPSVQIADERVDWPSLAIELQGKRATLRRWVEGDALERSEVYARGLVADVSYGSIQDPVSFAIAELASEFSLGLPVPDPLARVDLNTFPTPVATDIGDQGAIYPLIIGNPGLVEGSTNQEVVPVPVAQWDLLAVDTWVVVSEDGAWDITQVRIRNDELDASAVETVKRVQDLLGRTILVADFSASATPKPTTATENATLYAAYGSASSGGQPRDMYSAIRYLLTRFGGDEVDWNRIPDVRVLLEGYNVDTWVDSQVADPWVLIESWIALLPVELRVSQRGRYLAPRTWIASAENVVRDLTRGQELVRMSGIELTEPINQFAAAYRRLRTGDWHSQMILTGTTRQIPGAAPGVSSPDGNAAQNVSVVQSTRCQASQARYGLRHDPAGQLAIDWTWDFGTIVKLLELRAQAHALPSRLIGYQAEEALHLRAGDNVRVTDDEMGLENDLAVVDDPPVVGPEGMSIVLRIPL